MDTFLGQQFRRTGAGEQGNQIVGEIYGQDHFVLTLPIFAGHRPLKHKAIVAVYHIGPIVPLPNDQHARPESFVRRPGSGIGVDAQPGDERFLVLVA